ncbi:MAG: glutamine--fructose-6-phosphate transaminase (isomerizing) [Polyangiaceae bacterium]|nr:glutamine--fructose-6-phosphate transaminase (isomerizing) [Polyangiaceae bacterium]MCE7891343.1 glutamine--fructose-6-phosphate transaminase (isomerizing) [Sorangiineae bacterium PRO1]MCL4750393.1 glutamine--fructose-6-phosphate transaminase (isomerizing) [Myxococcales bacterium]
MCGIVGYVGPKKAAPILLDGLRRLEYRGYDSAGLAVHDGSQIEIVRAAGKLENLANALEHHAVGGSTGLGHTRWATHGRPSEQNAHPHAAGDVAVVHNGIIENYLELKHELEASGVRFTSDTDTEIVAHLINGALTAGAPGLFAAMRQALGQVRGAYALAAISRREPDRIVIAKSASPLVVGIGDGETLCGSDIPALLGSTRKMLFLEDGEMAELTSGGVRIETLAGARVERAPKHIDWSAVQAEKGGFKHFMLKEIFEQPRAVEDTLRGRISLADGDVVEGELGLAAEAARNIERVVLVACGTSHHAALVGHYWLEQLARVPAHTELASEVRYREPVFGPKDLVIAVSQSGETADTLAAVKSAREGGARVLAIANVLDSAIPRVSHGSLYTHAGPEIGVASTKCFTTQLVALLLLSVYLGRRRGTLDAERGRAVLQALLELPNDMRWALARKSEIHKVARHWYNADHMLFLGRGLGYPIALEGALKLKEISYAHAEGYAAGEMKHGPIALIDEHMPVVVVMPEDRQYEKTLSNVQEVRARDGQVIAIATEGDQEAKRMAQFVLELPKMPEVTQPIAAVVPLQLLAYYIADLKGTDVDQPRNLAKTVTVE